jgi:hypothetical protein
MVGARLPAVALFLIALGGACARGATSGAARPGSVGTTITTSGVPTSFTTATSTSVPPPPTTAAPSGPTTPGPTTPVPTTAGPAGGPMLPDPAFTPGATNAAVTQARIGQTICVSGWTATVRPAESYTNRIKILEAGAGGFVIYQGVSYPVHGFHLADATISHYELDHFIPLELGGSPADPHNLWMENRREFPGADEKDQLENYLHRQVCAGKMSLVAAQKAIVADWVGAYCAARLSECADGVHLVQSAVRPGSSEGD